MVVSGVVASGMVVSVVFSPVIFVVVTFASFIVELLRVTLLFLMIGTVVLILGLVPWVDVVVYGDVCGAVVAGSGHVNIPTFVELQIRSLTKIHNKNYAIFSQ